MLICIYHFLKTEHYYVNQYCTDLFCDGPFLINRGRAKNIAFSCNFRSKRKKKPVYNWHHGILCQLLAYMSFASYEAFNSRRFEGILTAQILRPYNWNVTLNFRHVPKFVLDFSKCKSTSHLNRSRGNKPFLSLENFRWLQDRTNSG